jgi:hypothetical protein
MDVHLQDIATYALTVPTPLTPLTLSTSINNGILPQAFNYDFNSPLRHILCPQYRQRVDYVHYTRESPYTTSALGFVIAGPWGNPIK